MTFSFSFSLCPTLNVNVEPAGIESVAPMAAVNHVPVYAPA
jgi:hypothetical protein